MLKKYGELILGIFVTLLAPFVFLLSTTIRQREVAGVGADFMPKIAAGIFLLTGILQIIGGVRVMKTVQGHSEAEAEAEARPAYLTVALTFALILLYVLLLEKVGFIITTTVYLFLQMNLLAKDKRNLLQLAVISIACAAGIFYLFRNVFDIMIPSGILG